jgi:hypothetical protein
MTYTLIAHTELTASQLAIDFTSVPQTFTDLLLVVSARVDGSSFAFAYDDGHLIINGSTANFSWRHLFGEGSGSGISRSDFARYAFSNSQATASTFGSQQFYIPNYRSTANRSISADGVTENNATTSKQIISASLFTSSAAITSIGVQGRYGLFVSGSSATLYGITAGSDGTTVVS